MRTVAFSDPRVVDLLNRKFICVWKNIRPQEQFADGIYKYGGTERSLAQLPAGTGDQNICAHVATADGTVLHAAQGFQGADALLHELEFGIKVAEAEAAKRTELYGVRRAEVGGRGDPGLMLLSKNIEVLAASSPSLDEVWTLTKAGLGREPSTARRK